MNDPIKDFMGKLKNIKFVQNLICFMKNRPFSHESSKIDYEKLKVDDLLKLAISVTKKNKKPKKPTTVSEIPYDQLITAMPSNGKSNIATTTVTSTVLMDTYIRTPDALREIQDRLLRSQHEQSIVITGKTKRVGPAESNGISKKSKKPRSRYDLAKGE